MKVGYAMMRLFQRLQRVVEEREKKQPLPQISMTGARGGFGRGGGGGSGIEGGGPQTFYS